MEAVLSFCILFQDGRQMCPAVQWIAQTWLRTLRLTHRSPLSLPLAVFVICGQHTHACLARAHYAL